MKLWLLNWIGSHEFIWVTFSRFMYWLMTDEEKKKYRAAMILKFPHLRELIEDL